MIQKIFPLKCLLFDVEGILTLQYRSLQPPFVTDLFYHEDRQALMKMMQKDFIIGIISSGETKLLRKICEDMKIPFIYLGVRNKIAVFEEMQSALNLKSSQFSHMGDGPLDADLFEKVGFSISVPNAPIDIQKKSLYCTRKEGGWGAVAEVCQLILHYQRGYH
jgi:3-deoxy-D-manno-octulosonate 8-phosphate phosphatase (KDO 8-P phosphatase)